MKSVVNVKGRVENQTEKFVFILLVARVINALLNFKTNNMKKTKKQQYVLGFLFSDDGLRIALIRKTHPEWQKGFLNGVGGKMEEGETARGAMSREFEEEAGVSFNEFEWEYKSMFYGDGFVVHVFCAFSQKIYDIKTMTDEIIEIHRTEDMTLMNTEILSNLSFLIPLCILPEVNFSQIEYKPNN